MTRQWSVVLRVVLTIGALGWAALIVLAPSWQASGESGHRGRHLLSGIVRMAGAQVCHQRADRSFHLHGRPLAVCGRCTGLYVAAAVGLLVVAARRRPLRPSSKPAPAWWPAPLDVRAGWLAVAALPTALTWSLEVVRMWNPGTPVRALAALPLGMTAGWLLGRALDR